MSGHESRSFRAGSVNPWAALEPWQRELSMRIGSAVAVRAIADARVEVDKMRAAVMAAHSGRARIITELDRRADRAVPGVERDTWLEAAAIARGQERSEDKGADHG